MQEVKDEDADEEGEDEDAADDEAMETKVSKPQAQAQTHFCYSPYVLSLISAHTHIYMMSTCAM